MRIAWSKGSKDEMSASSFVDDIVDLDSGRSLKGTRVYLVDEEAGYIEQYKLNSGGYISLTIEDGEEVAAWERIYGRFKIIWKENAPKRLLRD